MGSLESRLGAAEEALLDSLMVEMMVEAELQAMLAALEASEDIDAETYEKVLRILTDAGYIEEATDGA
jgi:SOS response regulatory protein OraA/RecX